MNQPKIVSRAEWLAARTALLHEEKELTRQRDAVAAARRDLPWVEVDDAYRFDTPEGEQTLADLFGPHPQLVVQHFMFGPDWTEGCPSCSFWMDSFDGLDVHLAQRNIGFVLVSRAPLDRLLAYRERMGWRARWVSSAANTFNQDFGVTFEDGADKVYNYAPSSFPGTEAPGVSVFAKSESGTVFHTYSTYARGLDILNSAYHLMDLTPRGRDEAELPWPMAWLRRHDQYDR